MDLQSGMGPRGSEEQAVPALWCTAHAALHRRRAAPTQGLPAPPRSWAAKPMRWGLVPQAASGNDRGLKDTHSSSPSPLGTVNLVYLLRCLPGFPIPARLNPSCTQVAFCLVGNPWLLGRFLTSAGAFWETLPN